MGMISPVQTQATVSRLEGTNKSQECAVGNPSPALKKAEIRDGTRNAAEMTETKIESTDGRLV